MACTSAFLAASACLAPTLVAHKQVAALKCNSFLRRSQSSPGLLELCNAKHNWVSPSSHGETSTMCRVLSHTALAGANDCQQPYEAGEVAQTAVADQAVFSTSVAGSFASLSRVLLVGQPTTMLRNFAKRKFPSALGPVSLLLFLFGVVLALVAAVRNSLIRKVKSCKSCKGFGLCRCRLCDGQGNVDWKAKFQYSEQCPLCLGKRFVVCQDCGGHYHRKMFTHTKTAQAKPAFAAGDFVTLPNPAD